jgi:hypothetical protein
MSDKRHSLLSQRRLKAGVDLEVLQVAVSYRQARITEPATYHVDLSCRAISQEHSSRVSLLVLLQPENPTSNLNPSYATLLISLLHPVNLTLD